MLRAAEAEILDVVANANNNNDDEQKAIIMRVRVKASPERIAELQESLNKWCEAVQEGIDCDADDAEEFGGLIAFYPIDQRLR